MSTLNFGQFAVGDDAYDDRLANVLQCAFHGWTADTRQILELAESTFADHETTERLTYDELLAITRLANPSGIPVRPIVVIIDDVLTSGKHFKVAQSLISAEYPSVEIRGLFLARCVHDDPAQYFDVIPEE